MIISPIRPILGTLSKTLIALSLAAWVFTGSSAFAHGGGGGGGGGHGGGGFGGGHMGGGFGGGHMGGFGGYGGGFGRGYGGYGGYGGFYPGLFLGGYGLGYGLGYGGYGLGYGGYGMGYGGYGMGYGLGGYGYGYPYGYGYGYYPYGYGSGYGNYYDPYTYTSGYTYPTTTYTSGYGPTGVQSTVPVTLSNGAQGRILGIDEEPVVDKLGPGVKVARVYPGSVAERAGLQVGDVIHQANGYLTQVHGNLTWIINHHTPDGKLNLSVHKASNNRDATVVAQLP